MTITTPRQRHARTMVRLFLAIAGLARILGERDRHVTALAAALNYHREA